MLFCLDVEYMRKEAERTLFGYQHTKPHFRKYVLENYECIDGCLQIKNLEKEIERDKEKRFKHEVVFMKKVYDKYKNYTDQQIIDNFYIPFSGGFLSFKNWEFPEHNGRNKLAFGGIGLWDLLHVNIVAKERQLCTNFLFT